MRWYQFYLQKPKRWSRRAESDGSAVPKLKRVKTANLSPFLRTARWVFVIFVPFMLFYGYAVGMYFTFSQHWIGDLFPMLYSSNTRMFVIVITVAFQLGFYISMIWLSIYSCRFNRKYSRLAIAHRCHLCPRCGYILQSRIDDSQPCPECGQRISRREAVRIWARFIAG